MLLDSVYNKNVLVDSYITIYNIITVILNSLFQQKDVPNELKTFSFNILDLTLSIVQLYNPLIMR